MIKKNKLKINISNKHKRIIFIVVILIICCIRIGLCIYNYSFKYGEWKNEIKEIEIIQVEDLKEESIVYSCYLDKNKFLIQISDVDNVYNYKDKITVRCSNYKIEKYNNPYEFDYTKSLKSKGYISKIYASKILNVEEERKGILSLAYYIREKIYSNLEKQVGKYYSALITSIIYGDDSSLDETLKKKFSNIGIGHFLCVSGSHAIYLISVFEYITKDKKKNILSFLILLYLYYITLFKVSLLRVVIMYFLNTFFNRWGYYKKYILTLLIVIYINPFYIFSFGVIFSFLSTLGIHLFSNVIYSYMYVKICTFKKSRKVGMIGEYVIQSISQTISAQSLIIPFEISCFGKLSFICIISNLLLASVLNLVMISGFMMFILFFIPGISNIIIQITFVFIHMLVYITNILDSINYFNVYIPKFSILGYVLYYLFILVIIFKDKIWVYVWSRRKVVKSGLKLVQTGVITYFVIWYIYTMYLDSYIIFFNVGQGNMALIHKYTTNIIIDMGSTESGKAKSIISSFLKAKCIRNIECICITHMHSDHMNGVIDYLEDECKEANIDRIIYSYPAVNVEEYQVLRKEILRNNIIPNVVKGGDIFKINGVKISVLTPGEKYLKDNDMLNTNSTIYLVEGVKKKILFLGDSTKVTEKYLVEEYINSIDENKREMLKNISIVQIGHHGSSTSSLDSFISNFKGIYGIISAKKKVYGHPSDSTIKTLEKYKLKIRITEKEGAIVF